MFFSAFELVAAKKYCFPQAKYGHENMGDGHATPASCAARCKHAKLFHHTPSMGFCGCYTKTDEDGKCITRSSGIGSNTYRWI